METRKSVLMEVISGIMSNFNGLRRASEKGHATHCKLLPVAFFWRPSYRLPKSGPNFALHNSYGESCAHSFLIMYPQ